MIWGTIRETRIGAAPAVRLGPRGSAETIVGPTLEKEEVTLEEASLRLPRQPYDLMPSPGNRNRDAPFHWYTASIITRSAVHTNAKLFQTKGRAMFSRGIPRKR